MAMLKLAGIMLKMIIYNVCQFQNKILNGYEVIAKDTPFSHDSHSK